MAAIFK